MSSDVFSRPETLAFTLRGPSNKRKLALELDTHYFAVVGKVIAAHATMRQKGACS